MARNLAGLAVTVGFVILLLLGSAVPARGQVSINVNIGAPPPVVVHSPPTMLFLPEPGFYVAVGVPYDIYFVGGRYYYLNDDHWFQATGYGGPWVHVIPSALPPGLQKFKIRRLRSFRDREYHVYQAQGPDFRGRHFQAVSGGGNGRGNGRGRGNK
jgi:hypothetical protein